MEELNKGSKRLKTALNDHTMRLVGEIQKIGVEEKRVQDKFHELEEKKKACAAAHGNVDASDDDLIEINAGGKMIAARREVLCQLKETNLEALFSGRWEKKLPKDSSGRIFLDVNGDCFQAIVDWLNLLAISSEDEPPKPPSVDKEYMPILNHQLELFLNCDRNDIDNSNIIKSNMDAKDIHEWLEEDGLGVEIKLLYRLSRDGKTVKDFHKKCDNKGSTLVLIKTDGGGVVGGYTNTPWASSGGYVTADKAFIFALSSEFGTPVCKMKLKNTNGNSVYTHYAYGPVFGSEYGCDIAVKDSKLHLQLGRTYSNGDSSAAMDKQRMYNINEMEVFQISNDIHTPILQPRRKRKQNINDEQASDSSKNVTSTLSVSGEMGEAIEEQWKTLSTLNSEILSLEESFKGEEQFIDSFARSNTSDIITLNVSGTIMATRRDTMQITEDSMLAQQFDETKWTEQGNSPKVKEWTPDDVANWVKSVEDVPDDAAQIFVENEIKGSELLSLDKEGLKMLGVKRVGTICLLFDEIGKLKKEASRDVVTLIEHSPYCFGKILDYLRMKRFSSVGLGKEPAPPIICEHKKEMFEKVVKYYFPGESSKSILG